jgi:hypothetical protein
MRWLVLAVLAACGGSIPSTDPPDAPGGGGGDDAPPGPDGSEPALDPTPGTYRETCDGSGAVAIDFDHFLDVNDENQGVRIFRRAAAAAPVVQLDISDALGIADDDEADLEDVARVGKRLYLITSHGRNTSGKLRPTRYRFAAFDLAGTLPAMTLQPIGSSSRLLSDLLVAANWDAPDAAVIATLTASSRLDVQTDANLAPELAGTNIEGLASDHAGRLVIGFRNPHPNGPAIVVTLTNPDAVVAGQTARFGAAATLDLGGLGIRGMAWSDAHAAVLVLAGPSGGPGPFRLYKWSGALGAAPSLVRELTAPAASAPEAIVPYPGTHDIQILYDQGDAAVGGTTCKLATPTDRRFSDAIVRVE